MQLTFWGACGTVTGSMHEVDVDGQRFLLDCGIYQGRRKEAEERNSHFPFPVDAVAGVVLSHAHIDHSGNLPTLVKNGFSGPIYATPATADLCAVMLRDSAYIHEKDAAFLNKRRQRRRAIQPGLEEEAAQPLYGIEDAEATIPLFRPVPMYQPTELDGNLHYESFNAGHILGASAVLLVYHGGGQKIRLAFSGDVGRPKLPIVRDPDALPPVDYLILESTYGGRLHKDVGTVRAKLANVINRTCRRGGKVIVPAFTVGRVQQLVLMLHELSDAGQIPSIPIFVDSPLAVEATEVFRQHPECFDHETRRYLLEGRDPFGFARLRYIRDVSESKALNDLHGPFVIISASGMCEAGRILHHLRNNLEDPRNTVLITGFQAEHTLGRKLVDKLPEVPIFGELMRLRAEVETLNELSGHADQRELLEWLKPLATGLKKLFLVHGEPAQTQALAAAVQARYGLAAVIPTRGQSFELE
jgi:metallo-beta-lactamase family protein